MSSYSETLSQSCNSSIAVCGILYRKRLGKRANIVQIGVPSTSNNINVLGQADTNNLIAGDNFELFFDEIKPEVADETVESIEGIRRIVKYFQKSAIRK